MSLDEFKYKAFLSYSHKDQKAATDLHRYLERLQVPKDLRARLVEKGVATGTLFPIFRDREELPTSGDLGTTIEEALRKSKFLVVVCSPNAAKSLWVSEEILRFKQLGRGVHILAYIVGGAPNATDHGQPELEAFPDALRYDVDETGTLTTKRVEPLAADARSEGDGLSDARLKIAAGLLGVGFNDLKRRELIAARRRLRITQGISGLMTALAIVAVYFGVQSDIQRRKIEQQNQVLLLRESNILARQALAAAEKGEGQVAARQALTALPTNFEKPERPLAAAAVRALYAASAAPLEALELAEPMGGRLRYAQFSYDDKKILLSGDGAVGALQSRENLKDRQLLSQFDGIATAALFSEGVRLPQTFIWEAQRPGSIGVYEERDLVYMTDAYGLRGATVLREGKHAAFLKLSDGSVALFEKNRVTYLVMRYKDVGDAGIPGYLQSGLKHFEGLAAAEALALDPAKGAVLKRDADDRASYRRLEVPDQVIRTVPLNGKPVAAQFDRTGERVVVFSGGKWDTYKPQPQSAEVHLTDGSGPAVKLDTTSDWRCSGVSGAPAFRTQDDVVAAIGWRGGGTCVWDAMSGRLVDYLPSPGGARWSRQIVSPGGEWILAYDSNGPAKVWRTRRFLNFGATAKFDTFESPSRCRRNEMGHFECPTPQGGVLTAPKDGAIGGLPREVGGPWALYGDQPASASGRYLAVQTYFSAEEEATSRPFEYAFIDLKQRRLACRVIADEEGEYPGRGAFFFEFGPTVFLTKITKDGPVAVRLTCDGVLSKVPRDWPLKHGESGDPGAFAAINDLLLSKDGTRVLTLAGDRSWRLWDVQSSTELARGDAPLIINGFVETSDGHIQIVRDNFDDDFRSVEQPLQRVAVPPAVEKLAAGMRTQLKAVSASYRKQVSQPAD